MSAVPKPAPREQLPSYLGWLHDTQACLLSPEEPCTCGGYLDVVHRRYAIDAHHVRSRGARGSDRLCVPLCHHHHMEGHRIGWKSFAKRHSVDLAAEAARLYQTYLRETT